MESKKPGQYDHLAIEKKWQDEWQKDGIYAVADSVEGKENFYTLVEFSYPSGNLHTGHWYAFAVPDIFARYKRMRGYNVLYPMGFDAFGLPAENAAIKLGADPKIWTYTQMEAMRTQLRSMGAMFPWSREVVTCDPSYYKWTQWMFSQFLKHDLVYRDVTKVNWCPKDQTILANEQVVDGKCERCGSDVVQRDQEQWMLRITKYADRLLDDLDKLAWPEEIKASQRNWIGRSEGSEIEFKLVAGSQSLGAVKVFTTRADTLFGVTYLVLAPEHPLIKSFQHSIECWNDVEAYIDATRKKSELDRQQSKEKTGVELKGIKAINPANGEEVPVWIADYVLAGYGTGAVMAVPAHDERDFEFAKKYELPIREVVANHDIDGMGWAPKAGKKSATYRGISAVIFNKKDDTVLCLKWTQQGWGTFITGKIEEGENNLEEAARREIYEETGYKNLKLIYEQKTPYFTSYYHDGKDENRFTEMHRFFFELVDEEKDEITDEEKSKHELVWVRRSEIQKFITASYDQDIAKKVVNEAYAQSSCFINLGILVHSGQFNGLASEEAKKKITESVGGKMVSTYRLRDWGISRQRYWGTPIPIVYDPQGKAHPVPDEHLPWLLPTDVDHTPDGTAPLARSRELFERTEKIFGAGWTPEVETMDAFVDSTWYFYRYLDNKNENAFASKEMLDAWMPIDLYMGGAEHTTMHLLYSRFWVKAMHDLGFVSHDEAYVVRRNRGLILGPDGNKMSKSKGNVVNPDEIVERLGADTVRLYLGFMGPYGVTVNYPWDPNGVVGVRRFLERVWRLKDKIDPEKKICKTDPLVHKTVKGVGEDIEEFKFNTAIAKMMILLNALEKEAAIVAGSYETLLRLLAPFAPHMTEELWHQLGLGTSHPELSSIHLASWPAYDPEKATEETVTIGVQINGKVRAELIASRGASIEELEALALALPRVQEYLAGAAPKKIVAVPGRIVSIVT